MTRRRLRALVLLLMLLIATVTACGDDDTVALRPPGDENCLQNTGGAGVGVAGPTGVQLAGLTEAQLQIARNGVAIGKQRGMPESVLLGQSVAAATESTYRNLANSNVPESQQYPNDGVGSDADSVGPHQLKVQYWADGAGGIGRLMDPIYQINWFYDEAQKIPGYETMEPAALAQEVEDSSANAYAGQMDLARQVVDLFKNSPAPHTTSSVTSTTAATTSAGSSPSSTGKVIAIDPGHGPVYAGPNGEKTDAATGLVMKESPNQPEMQDVWDVSQRLKAALEREGYTVVITKDSVDQDIDFRARADKIKSSGAVLAVDIHTSGAGSPHQATPQVVGQYREYNGRRTEFTNTDTATRSQQAAEILARTRTAAEGHPVETTPITFFGRDRSAIPSPGDIPFVSLFSDTVPLVYNELGRDTGTDFNNGSDGLTDAGKDRYVEGLLDGIKEYASGATPSPQTQTQMAGSIVSNGAACGSSRDTGFLPGGPFGDNVVAAARRWIGTTYAWGGGNPDGPTKGITDGGVADSYGDFNKTGFDCSGLVLYAVAQASGKQILLAHYDETQINDPRGQRITNAADLRPGDIIQPNPGHIFIWTGPNMIIEAPQSGDVVKERPWTPTGNWKAVRFG